MKLWSQNKITLLFCYLLFISIFEMPDIGRHTKLDHGHLLSVWKAHRGPDTLENCHGFRFQSEMPEMLFYQAIESNR